MSNHESLELVYDSRIDVASWARRHELGEVPDRYPYGLDRIERHGYAVTAREAPVPFKGIAGRLERRFEHTWRHGFSGASGGPILSWDEKAGIPAVLTTRRPVVTGAIWASDDPYRLAALALPKAAAVWASSSAQLPALREIGVTEPRYVPMAIDAEFFTPLSSARRSGVLGVGNDKHRDHATFCTAANLLSDDLHPTVELVTRLRVKEPGRVKITAEVSHTHLRDRYRGARVVALALKPNIHVSGVTALLEAMACARPVVITDNPGISDYIQDGVAGFVVPPGDPCAMACAIEKLVRDPEMGDEMGKRGRLAVDARFTTEIQAASLAKLVRSVA